MSRPGRTAEVAEPLGTFPRRSTVRSKDGRRWDVLSCAGQVVAATPGGTVAGATVEDTPGRVVVQFWTSPALPSELCTELVATAFAHPAFRAHRPVLVCTPAGESHLLIEARRHLAEPRSQLAGSTCLLEGRIATDDGAHRRVTPPRKDRHVRDHSPAARRVDHAGRPADR